jgi:hypothetical protein
MRVFMGVVLAVFGIYALTSLFVPKYRLPWKGRTEPAGRITHLGFGLTFFCFGFLFVIKDYSPMSAGILAIGGLFGTLLAAIGNFIDP